MIRPQNRNFSVKSFDDLYHRVQYHDTLDGIVVHTVGWEKSLSDYAVEVTPRRSRSKRTVRLTLSGPSVKRRSTILISEFFQAFGCFLFFRSYAAKIDNSKPKASARFTTSKRRQRFKTRLTIHKRREFVKFMYPVNFTFRFTSTISTDFYSTERRLRFLILYYSIKLCSGTKIHICIIAKKNRRVLTACILPIRCKSRACVCVCTRTRYTLLSG